MQLSYLDQAQAADMLEDSSLLTKIEGPGSAMTYVLEHGGRDVLMISDSITGNVVVIEPDSVDQESGGSVHDHARAIFGAAPVDAATA